MSTYSEVLAIIDAKAELSLHGITCDAASGDIITALKRISQTELTTERYKELREHYMAHLPDGVSADAAKQRWSRLIDAAGLEIPKSQSKVATDTASKRQQEKDRLAALSLEEVEKCMLTAKTDNDFASAAKYKRELDRRATDLLKPEIEARKAEAKEVKALISDKLTLDQLKAIHAAVEKIIKG